MVSLKRAATINDEALSESTAPNFDLNYVDIGNVDSNGHIHDIVAYQFANAPSRARRIVRHGDVIISTVRTYLQAIASIDEPPDNLIVSTGFAVVRPVADVLDTNFCKYALREAQFIHEVINRSAGVSYPAISASDLGDIPIFLPPLATQRAIAAYLDRETAKIDAMIDAKQRLRELLKEKRRALITHAVTRGLDPNAPLRESGVPWIGKVPAHWDVVRLKLVGKVRTGVAKGRSLGNRETVYMPYLRVANVQDGYLDLSDILEIEVLPEEVEAYSLRSGDVLMNEGGDADKLGRGTVWNGSINPCLHQNHVFVVRCFDINPHWLNMLTSSHYAKAYLESHSKQTTNLASISSTNLQELSITIPPVEEQSMILQFISQNLANVTLLAETTQRSIDLLHERRAALITAAVTGQIAGIT